jgi:uncharacterized membrane protein (DUF4010 family)
MLAQPRSPQRKRRAADGCPLDADALAHVLGPLRELAIAAGLGLLVGLERERAKATGETEEVFLGVRTLPLVAVWGVLASWLSRDLGTWVLSSSLLGLLGLLGINYYVTFRARTSEPGLTTAMATVVTFLLGAVVESGYHFVAVVVAVAMTALLAYKPQIHRIARGLSQRDLSGILQFVVLMAIVLPLLPDTPIDPEQAIRPREVGWMVVLIAGIGLVGFLLMRLIGARRGIRLTGGLGGLVSSTAVVLSFSRRSREAPAAAREFGFGMGLACAIMYPRMLALVFAVDRGLVPWASATLVPMVLATFVAFRWLSRRAKSGGVDEADLELRNPTDLKVAFQFGALYAGVRWASAFLAQHAGVSSLYLLALAAGAADVDAITLSVSQMAGREVSRVVAVQAITIAAISNTLVKLALAWSIGARGVRLPAAGVLLPGAAAGLLGVGLLAWLAG